MLNAPEYVKTIPLSAFSEDQRYHFEDVECNAWPEVGSRMMTRLITGQDLKNGWVVVQDSVYRYAVIQDGSLTVRSVIRDYLATDVHWLD